MSDLINFSKLNLFIHTQVHDVLVFDFLIGSVGIFVKISNLILNHLNLLNIYHRLIYLVTLNNNIVYLV
jgi:hypothetical protein